MSTAMVETEVGMDYAATRYENVFALVTASTKIMIIYCSSNSNACSSSSLPDNVAAGGALP